MIYMIFYSIDWGKEMILKVPEHCSYSVFDAKGNPLNWVVWADTETGMEIAGIAHVLKRLKVYPEQLDRTKQDDIDLLYKIAGADKKNEC